MNVIFMNGPVPRRPVAAMTNMVTGAVSIICDDGSLWAINKQMLEAGDPPMHAVNVPGSPADLRPEEFYWPEEGNE